jgi:hypothetical protein
VTTGGPTYIPHLRAWVQWEYDTSDWPFVPLQDTETEEERTTRMLSLSYVIRYGQHWLEVPRSDEPEFLDYRKAAVENYLTDMAASSLWDLSGPDNNQRPIATILEINAADFGEKQLMAHVFHQTGFFASVSEARKAGWGKPIVPGLYRVGKDKRRVLIHDKKC